MNAMMKTVGWVKPFGYAQDKLRVTHHQGKKLMGFTHPTRATLLDLTPMFRATAQHDGMRTMREDGERWLADGTTTQAELLRVTRD